MATKLKRLRVDEGSLVDKGANQDAMVVLFKRDTKGGEQVDVVPKERFEAFFKATFGYGDDEAKTFDDALSQAVRQDEMWKLNDALRSSINSILDDADVTDKRTAISESLSQYLSALITTGIVKAGKKISGNRMAMLEEMKTMMDKASTMMQTMMDEASPQDDKMKKGSDSMPITEEIKKKLTDEEITALEEIAKKAEQVDGLVTKLKELEDKIEALTKAQESPKDEDILKGADPAVKKMFEDIKKENEANKKEAEEAKEIAKAERETRIAKEYIEKAKGFPHMGNAEDVAGMLRKAYESSDEDGKKLEETLKAANEKIEANDRLAKELGRGGANSGSDAMAKIEGIAKSLKDADPKLTPEEAMTKAMETAEGKALYDTYENERVVN